MRLKRGLHVRWANKATGWIEWLLLLDEAIIQLVLWHLVHLHLCRINQLGDAVVSLHHILLELH